MEKSDSPPAKKRCVNKAELENLSKDEIIEWFLDKQKYCETLENARSGDAWNSSELVCLRESEEKLKQQQIEATRRENVLVMRLTTKEQEMHDYMNQIQELKQSQMPSMSQLRSTLTDPAVNLLFEGLKKELKSTKARLEETQNELSAWKFTPDSNTGKRLMAKCRLLYQENEELGKAISAGKMAKLEGDLALQKNFCEELRKSQSEMEDYLEDVEEEVEGMQSTILYLQNQLRESKDKQNLLQDENSKLLANSNSSCGVHNLRTSTDNKDNCGNKIEKNSNPPQSKISENKGEDAKTARKIVNIIESNLQNTKSANNSIQNGNCIEKNENEYVDVSSCTATSNINDEPMDTSTSEKTRNQSVSDENRTPNGEGSSSSESRTTKNNHGVDIDTEVQVAQTLASWANCENDSEKVSPKSSREKLGSDVENVSSIIQNSV